MKNEHDCFYTDPSSRAYSRNIPAAPGPDDVPVAPLPPIVGSPEAPGPNIPVIPLPPIVGSPAPPGSNIPVFPLPPIVGSPAPPGSNIPVFPLPPIIGVPDQPGSGIPVIPLPPIGSTPPSPPGNQTRYCQVRFLHASPNYSSFHISIGSQRVVSNLSFGNFSEYIMVPDGFRGVTVMNTRSPRTVLLQKSVAFRGGDRITLAIIEASGGIELNQISDRSCNKASGLSCLRVTNFALNSPPLDLLLSDGRIVFSDIYYKETTGFNRVRPGNYGFVIAETPQRSSSYFSDVETLEDVPILVSERYVPGYGEVNPLFAFQLRVRPNTMYTIYIIGQADLSSDIQVLIAENF